VTIPVAKRRLALDRRRSLVTLTMVFVSSLVSSEIVSFIPGEKPLTSATGIDVVPALTGLVVTVRTNPMPTVVLLASASSPSSVSETVSTVIVVVVTIVVQLVKLVQVVFSASVIVTMLICCALGITVVVVAFVIAVCVVFAVVVVL